MENREIRVVLFEDMVFEYSLPAYALFLLP
jgi:hypothetical protein